MMHTRAVFLAILIMALAMFMIAPAFGATAPMTVKADGVSVAMVPTVTSAISMASSGNLVIYESDSMMPSTAAALTYTVSGLVFCSVANIVPACRDVLVTGRSLVPTNGVTSVVIKTMIQPATILAFAKQRSEAIIANTTLDRGRCSTFKGKGSVRTQTKSEV